MFDKDNVKDIFTILTSDETSTKLYKIKKNVRNKSRLYVSMRDDT